MGQRKFQYHQGEYNRVTKILGQFLSAQGRLNLMILFVELLCICL